MEFDEETTNSNINNVNIDAETRHWIQVMRTFLSCDDFFMQEMNRRQDNLNKLSNDYFDRLPQIAFEKFNTLRDASLSNQYFFDEMVDFHFNSNFNYNVTSMPTKEKG
jgi:hypothetical protein